MRGKRGSSVSDILVKIGIALAFLVVMFIAYLLISGKLQSFVRYFVNFLRLGGI